MKLLCSYPVIAITSHALSNIANSQTIQVATININTFKAARFLKILLTILSYVVDENYMQNHCSHEKFEIRIFNLKTFLLLLFAVGTSTDTLMTT